MTRFQQFYDNVKRKDAIPIRIEIEKIVASQTFRNWASGRYEPDGSCWNKINEIAIKFGYKKPYIV